jgi:uncharacterized protein YndB with AHSA1/START domain
MKHLDVLEDAGLVVVRRHGRERWNHLNAVPLRRIYEHYIDPVSDHLASSLLRLAHTAERKEPSMSPTAELAVRTMTIEQEITVAAPAARIFRALTDELNEWWSPRTYDAPSTVAVDARIGGYFTERHHDDVVLWAIVSCIEPNKKLVFNGPFGLSKAGTGVVTFELEENGEKTTVRVSHRAFGEITDEQVAGYGRGWQRLMQTDLPNWVERGERCAIE